MHILLNQFDSGRSRCQTIDTFNIFDAEMNDICYFVIRQYNIIRL